MREIPLGSDGDFKEVALVDRANAELANDLGNLLQRCLSMAAKHNGGRLSAGAGGAGGLQEEDIALLEEAGALLEVVRKKDSITYIIILVKGGGRFTRFTRTFCLKWLRTSSSLCIC